MKRLTILLALLLIAALVGSCSVSELEKSDPPSGSADGTVSDTSAAEIQESGNDSIPDTYSSAADPSESAAEESGNDGHASSGESGQADEPKEAKEFTSLLKWEDEGVELCLPEDREMNMFSDCGINCLVTVDCYDGDVVAYHDYDDQGGVVKKTVGKHTYDYQSFDYLGLENWHIFVIRIAFTESRNQMEHRYYKILFTAYGAGYPESQVEKFMKTLRFTWFDKDE